LCTAASNQGENNKQNIPAMNSNSLKETVLREATLEDAARLRDCMIAAYSGYQERLQGIQLPPLIVDYAAEISNYPTWVADRDGEIVAGLIMTFNSVAMLSNIAVHPQAQGNGLGRRLLDFAEQQAKEQGFSRMRLATHRLLTENISLYQHFGWELVGQDEERVTMEKSIF
jgi:GNAT superfamily N-acetyltransferase